jgi:hypothetical protein
MKSLLSANVSGLASGHFDLRQGVGQGEEIRAKEVRDLLRVQAVIFIFPPVDGFHVQGMAQVKWDVLPPTAIREPIPIKGGFYPHGDVIADGERGTHKRIPKPNLELPGTAQNQFGRSPERAVDYDHR